MSDEPAVLPANATAPADAAPADAAPDADAPGTPMMFWIWGLFSGWMTASGYLTYAAYYTTFTDTLYNARTGGTNASWTKAYIQETNPVAMWIYSSYGMMGMSGLQTLAWLMGVIGMKPMFMMVFKLSMLFPLIELGLWGYTYSLYQKCSGVTDAQFDGATTTVTQTVSCMSASETTTTTGKFGTSGTVAKSVSADPYTTWFGANVGSSTFLLLLNMMSKGPFSNAFGKKPADDSAADADAAPVAPAAPADDDAAPADPAPADDPSATTDPAPADDPPATTDPAPTDPTPEPTAPVEEPQGPGDGGNQDNEGFGSGADWNEPTNEPEPEPEEPAQQCGYWGCL